MGILKALPAGIVDGVGVSRIARDAMGGCGYKGILAGEVELADGHRIPCAHRFGVSSSRRFSSGDGLLRFFCSGSG